MHENHLTFQNDYETLGTLLLKLERDERDAMADWGACVKTGQPLYGRSAGGRHVL